MNEKYSVDEVERSSAEPRFDKRNQASNRKKVGKKIVKNTFPPTWHHHETIHRLAPCYLFEHFHSRVSTYQSNKSKKYQYQNRVLIVRV